MIGSHISLFAGVGMGDIAAEAAGYKTIATAEIDPFCRSVLQARFPAAHHFDDVRKVTTRHMQLNLPGVVKRPLLVSGGFPCQGIAAPGLAAGLNDPRSGLWTEFARVIREFQPDKVLIENSPMLRSRGLDRVLCDLCAMGYDAVWDCIPAAAVGAPHLRDRIWIVATPSKGVPPWWADASWVVRTYHDYIIPGRGLAMEVTRFPRAGTMRGRCIREDTPRSTIKEAKTAILAHAVPCPATPYGAWPTPNHRDYKDSGVKQGARKSPNLGTMVARFPTPTRSDGSGGPGTTPRRTGGKNLRTFVADSDGNGRLNPEWVEWMMGLPLGWTSPECTTPQPHPDWSSEHGIPRTVPNGQPLRGKRIRALGNGLVPQVARFALDMKVDA